MKRELKEITKDRFSSVRGYAICSLSSEDARTHKDHIIVKATRKYLYFERHGKFYMERHALSGKKVKKAENAIYNIACMRAETLKTFDPVQK